MNETFDKLIKRLPFLLDDLVKSHIYTREEIEGMPEEGVCIFYEDTRPIYVSRSNRMKEWVKCQGRPSSTHNNAPLAFNIARKVASEKGINVRRTRTELEKDPDFRNLFLEAKKRVGKMYIRVIKIDDQIEQTLLVVYAVMELKTTEFNSFETH